MKNITKQRKEKPTIKKKETKLPIWFESEQNIKETTTEEVEELDKILNELI